MYRRIVRENVQAQNQLRNLHHVIVRENIKSSQSVVKFALYDSYRKYNKLTISCQICSNAYQKRGGGVGAFFRHVYSLHVSVAPIRDIHIHLSQ